MALSTYAFTMSCAAPPDVLFDVVADVTRWHEWAGWTIGSSTFEHEGHPSPGGVGAVRRMGRWPLFTREQIAEYDPPRHLGYTVLSGFPVRGYHADVDFIADGRGGTELRWSGAYQPLVPWTGAVLEPFVEHIVRTYAKAAVREAERRTKR